VSERGELHEIFGNSEGSWLCLPASGFVKMLVVQLDRDALRDLCDFKRVGESIPKKSDSPGKSWVFPCTLRN
jgi:hypothetical protein